MCVSSQNMYKDALKNLENRCIRLYDYLEHVIWYTISSRDVRITCPFIYNSYEEFIGITYTNCIYIHRSNKTKILLNIIAR